MRRQIKLKLLLIKTYLYKFFKNKKKLKKVAILSCSNWKNKVSDDLLIMNKLLHNGINASIVAWDCEEVSNYDLVIVRTIWGYEKNLEAFEEFLSKLESLNVKVLNNISVMKNNYYKDVQCKLLDKYEVPHINTYFVDKGTEDIESVVKNIKANIFNDLVIKPCISASGGNTYLISDDKSKSNVIDINKLNENYKDVISKSSLMVQPFINEIKDGEISIIVIGNTITHGVIRYPKPFNLKNGVTWFDNGKVNEKMKLLVDKVNMITEYHDVLYKRIDMVKIGDDYSIMEIELVEPDLFIRNVNDKVVKDFILDTLVNEIRKEL